MSDIDINNIKISLPSPRSEIELDDFQNTFVGRYNELLYIFEKKVSNLNEIVKLIEPYIEIEKAYVQNFEKFIKQNKNFLGAGSLSGNSNFFDSGFDPKLSVTFDLFKHWLNILHSSSDATVRKFKATKEELEKFNSEFDHEKKKELSSATKKLFKLRDKYYKTCREELSLALPDTAKMTTDRNAYIYHVNSVNSQYKNFFKMTFPTKLSEVRSLFIQRIHKIQLVLESIVTSKIDSFKELNESINGQLLSSISSIEIEDEIEEIIKKYNPSRDKFDKTISFTFQEFSEKQPISQSLLASAVADSPIQLIPSVSSHEMSDSIQSPPGTAAPALSPKLVHTRSKMDLGLNLSLIDESSSKKTKNPFKMITSRRNHERRRSSDFGNGNIQANAPPSPTEGYANAQDSPTSSSTMSAISSPVVVPGDFGANAELSVMKVPLEVLVERETRANPGATLPRVETFLVESLLEKDLKELKGLFKRGAKLPLINTLKSSLDSGMFEPPSDPYVCADVLKHWVRNLPEPLISNDLYEEAIKCCDYDQSVKVFNQLKEPNKSVLGYLVCFVSHYSEFSADTGVKDSDLANVFSPCIMKCPYTDVNEMIAATEKQTDFVLGLLDAVKNGLIPQDNFNKSLEKVKLLKTGNENENADPDEIEIVCGESIKSEVETEKEREFIISNKDKEHNIKIEKENVKEENVNDDHGGETSPPPLPSCPPPPLPSCPPPPLPKEF